MFWAVHCLDHPDAANRRAAARAEHSARLARLRDTGTGPRVLLYGPLLGPDGETQVGSLFLVEAGHLAAVEDFVDQDPFSTGDVWGVVDIRAFTPSGNSVVTLPVTPETPEPRRPPTPI